MGESATEVFARPRPWMDLGDETDNTDDMNLQLRVFRIVGN
jgi:hypothetical protein